MPQQQPWDNMPLPTKEQLMQYFGGVAPTQMGPPQTAMMTPEPVMEAAQNLQPAPQAPAPQAPAPMPVVPRETIGVSHQTRGPAPGSDLQSLIGQLNGRELESLKQQGLSVEALKKQLGAVEGKELPVDLTGLAALTDAWSGSNFTKSYAPPETLKDRKTEIARLQSAIASGGNNLSENEIGLLRSQLNNAFQMDNLSYRKDQDKEQNAIERARIAKMGTGREGGKILPGSAINQYNESQGIVGLASGLTGLIKDNAKFMGPVSGGFLGKNPYDAERRNLDSQFQLVQQRIGKMVEGGVLRAEDVPKYKAILPNSADLPEVAGQKAARMESMLKDDISRYMENYGKAGYDVSGFAKETAGYKSDAAEIKGEQKKASTRAEKEARLKELERK